MQKTLKILWHEIYMLISRFSFWFSVLGVPLVGFVVYGGVALINQNAAGGDQTADNNGALAAVGKIFTPSKTRARRALLTWAG